MPFILSVLFFFLELREKRLKLDQAEKLLLNSKIYWILLKTWAYLFVWDKLFQWSDFKLLELAKKCKQIGPQYHHLTLSVWLHMQFLLHLYINTTTSTGQLFFSLKYVFRVPNTIKRRAHRARSGE